MFERKQEGTQQEFYDELIRSISPDEKPGVEEELAKDVLLAKRAEVLCQELAENKRFNFPLNESRNVFLAALLCLSQNKISAAQLASLHILDSAIRTLYINPMVYFTNRFVDANGAIQKDTQVLELGSIKKPSTVRKLWYNAISVPKLDMQVMDLPKHMQQPLLRRFFNFNDFEWAGFCFEMKAAPLSEQYCAILDAPLTGCWSGLIFEIQEILQCMRVLDVVVETKDNLFVPQSVMLAPSFSMFQAAINAKAKTLGRKPVTLIPTYGYIDAEHYAALKAQGKIAFAMYLPERDESLRYKFDVGNFRTTIDGHPKETAFAGAIHDVYHAMRELIMSENVAKARWRLAAIAKAHSNNIKRPGLRGIDDLLVDGELIYSYSPERDTIFDHRRRPGQALPFGSIFYANMVAANLHENLKRAFIEDMVKNKQLWATEFNIGRLDLLPNDLAVYDEIERTHNPSYNIAVTGLFANRPQQRQQVRSDRPHCLIL